MKAIIFFTCLVVVSLSLPQTSMANCEVTLKVSEKRGVAPISHGGSPPETHTVILKSQGGIAKTEKCAAYSGAQEFHMNNVEQHDKAFQDMEAGDVVTGTLNYHRPSPYGKHLHDNYHHGFRLLERGGEDYSQQHVYFRHIGLY